MRFTELAIDRLRPPASGEVVYWDATAPGFGLRVSAAGRKTWIVAVKGSKRRLGHYPKMSLKDARARLSDGAPSVTTFAALADAFLDHGRTRRGRPLRANTIAQYRRLLHGATKSLHARRVREIDRADIAALTKKVAAESGAPMASLVRSALGRLWTYAIEVGEADSSPVAGSPGYGVSKRTRVLSDPEIAALWSATEEVEEYNLIVRLCLWTGCRRSEAGGLRWSELRDGIWTIPGARTKNHRPLVLPLPHQALDAIALWPRVVGKELLFGRNSPRGFAAWSSAKKNLDQRLLFSQDFNVHDIRRTVETRLAKLGVSKDVRSRLLNHDVGNIDEAYQHHDFLEEKREALQRWADTLDTIARLSESTLLRLRG
jgi:integrase